MAYSTTVIQALDSDEDNEDIQAYANEIKDRTNVGFVVVLDMDLIRKSHPLEEEVGQSFFNREDAQAALKGEEYFSIEEGPLGMGLRVFTPVYDDQGEQIGIVVVGVSLDTVNALIAKSQKYILIGSIIQLVIGGIGAYFLSGYIKKKLYGLEPIEIAKILKERNSMIESVKEGIIAVNEKGQISLINEEALRMMEAGEERSLMGEQIADYMPIIDRVMSSGKEERNFEQELSGRAVMANCFPIIVNDKVVGGIAIFRDKTEVKELAEQLTGIKLYSESLRAQSHEFMNKLHVILGLIHLKKYEEVNKYIENMVDDYEVEKGLITKRIKNSIFAGFMLGKMSKAREQGIHFSIDESSYLCEDLKSETIHGLIRIAGNLIENAYDAVSSNYEKKVHFLIHSKEKSITMKVRDNGHGMSTDVKNRIFQKGYSTKGEDRGYGLYLTKESITNLKGTIEINSSLEKGTIFTVKIPLGGQDS